MARKTAKIAASTMAGLYMAFGSADAQAKDAFDFNAATATCSAQAIEKMTGQSPVINPERSGTFSAFGTKGQTAYATSNSSGSDPSIIVFQRTENGQMHFERADTRRYGTPRGAHRLAKMDASSAQLNWDSKNVAAAELAQMKAEFGACMYAHLSGKSSPILSSRPSKQMIEDFKMPIQNTDPTPKNYKPVIPRGGVIQSNTNASNYQY